MAIPLTDTFGFTPNKPNIDKRYLASNGQPYASVAAAETALASRLVETCIGLTVLVKESGWTEAKEYWVQPLDTTPVTYGFVPKQAAEQVQADWNVSDSGSPAFIKNKPTIPSVPVISTDIASDAASDAKTASPKAVKNYFDSNKPSIQDSEQGSTAVTLDGTIHVSAIDAEPNENAGVEITPHTGGGVNMKFILPKGDTGNDGSDGHNPCLGRFTAVPSTFTETPRTGDYYFVDTVDTSTTPPTVTETKIYKYDGTQWDSGTVVYVSNLTFNSGESVTGISIDGTQLAKPAPNALAKAGDVSALLKSVDETELRTTAVSGFITAEDREIGGVSYSKGDVVSSTTNKYSEFNVVGATSVRFLGEELKPSSMATSGYAFYDENGDVIEESCKKFDIGTGSSTITKEYILSVPAGAVIFKTTSYTYNTPLTESTFYFYKTKVSNKIDEMEDKVEEIADNSFLSHSDSEDDLVIVDKYGNILVEFKNGHIHTKNFNSEDALGKKKFKMLMIGNSYSQDCIAYLPWLIKSVDSSIDFELGVAKVSSSSLSTNYNNIVNDNAVYEFDYINSSMAAWQVANSQKFSTIINYADWDILTIQQYSRESPIIGTYQPYLNNIINLLFSFGNYRLGWLLTQASADGAKSEYGNTDRFPTAGNDPDGLYQTSDDMFGGIAECAQTVIATTPIDFVIPSGTAIQNGRHNSTIKNIGDFSVTGHSEWAGQLTIDGGHLQDGLPSLLSGYTALLFVLDAVSRGHGIVGNSVRPTSDWQTGKNIIGSHIPSVGVTDANCLIAQKCAMAAWKKPFVITENIL